VHIGEIAIVSIEIDALIINKIVLREGQAGDREKERRVMRCRNFRKIRL
jgi:hypothetical protein